jgi:hypothetical protein
MANPSMMSDASTERRSASGGPVAGAKPRQRGTTRARSRTSPRFYCCVGILLLAAVGMNGLAHHLAVTFRKSPVPLRQPLDALDQAKLLPEYRPHRIQPEPLSAELLENLGTEEYLQWYVADEQRDRDDPTAIARLFVTYFTGQPDLVPHNPKECYAAGGATLLKETGITVTVPRPVGGDVQIPVSVLEFEPPRRYGSLGTGGPDVPHLFVAYFFYANGQYVTSRTGVRYAISNLWDRYAYYSKVELTFSDDTLRKQANREETVDATRRFLRKVMPILWEDHYQDWEALTAGAPPEIRDR